MGSSSRADEPLRLPEQRMCVIFLRDLDELTMRKPLTPADLPEDLARFVEARIAAGLSADAEDALRAGKAALEAEQRRRDAKLAKLREAIDEGDASGVFEGDAFASVRAELGLPPR